MFSQVGTEEGQPKGTEKNSDPQMQRANVGLLLFSVAVTKYPLL